MKVILTNEQPDEHVWYLDYFTNASKMLAITKVSRKGLPTFLPTAFLTKRSEQSWSEVYKKCISDQKFWAKIPWS